EGRLFALVILMAGMLNVLVQGQTAPRVLWAGCIPFALILLGLPLASMVIEADGRPLAMSFLVLAGLFYLIHLISAVRRNDEIGAVLRGALGDAKTERLRAEQANAAKSDFLATMSHEIRTPLNGVLGMVQAMSKDALPPAQKERLEVVRQSGEVLLVLLNDLLDISKVEAAKIELEDGVVRMEEILAQTEAVFAPLAAAKALSFRVWISDAARGARRGDPTRVRQVLYNLLSNSLKFTVKGRVTVFVSGGNDDLVIEVSDTGPGIAAEQLSLLFERFIQADATTTRRFGGSGLGLSISRGLARAMGGDITARSSLGEGSVFTVTLPLRLGDDEDAEQPQPSAAAQRADEMGARSHMGEALPQPATRPEPVAQASELRILAAEDNPTNQLVLRTLFQQIGVTLHVVGNGREAVEAWRSARWDVILMDIQMPEMDGLTAACQIREAEVRMGGRRTPIIALTANAMTHHAREYTAAGMDALSPKPVQFEALIATINGLLDAEASEAEAAQSGG
ncbi:MAG: ATP-binding protein, partial [Phenylobacterium sp.]